MMVGHAMCPSALNTFSTQNAFQLRYSVTHLTRVCQNGCTSNTINNAVYTGNAPISPALFLDFKSTFLHFALRTCCVLGYCQNISEHAAVPCPNTSCGHRSCCCWQPALNIPLGYYKIEKAYFNHDLVTFTQYKVYKTWNTVVAESTPNLFYSGYS